MPRSTGPFYKVIEGPGGDMGFAKAVHNLGDTDGDGTDDLMVIRGGPYGSETTAYDDKPYGPENYLLAGSREGDLGGNAMIGFDDLAWTFRVGDLNGDGLADSVSTRYPMRHHPLAWQVDSKPATLEIRYGVSSGLPLSPDATIELLPVAIPMSNWSTLAVRGVGDVNGDGYNDLLVICETHEYSQDRYLVGRPAPQEISLYYGSEDGLGTTPGWSRVFGKDEGRQWYDLQAILHADLNGDGCSDIVFCFRLFTDVVHVGTPDYYHRIAVHYGSVGGLSIEPDWVNSGSWMDEYVPTQVRVGRFDGDDVPDLMVLDEANGAIGFDATGKRMRIFLGSVDGIGKEPDDTMFFPKGLPRNLVVADVNGDGLDDLVRISIMKLPPVAPFGSRESGPTRLNVTFRVDINIDGQFQPLDTFLYRFTSLLGDQVTSCTRGDLDGDGIDDIVLGIIGTKAETEPGEWTIYPGKVLVLFGSGFRDVPAPLQVSDGPRLYSEYKAYSFLVSDSSGGSPLPKRVRLTLDPGGENIIFGWRYKEVGPDTFERPDTDSARLMSREEDVVREPDTGTTKVDFKVIFGWSWSHEDQCDVVVEVIDEFGFVRQYLRSSVFSVENDLDFAGETQILGEVQGRISDGDWVAGGERVFVEGVKVVYEGTDSAYPPEGVCNIALFTDGTSYALAPNGPHGSFETSLIMGNETDPEVNFTLTARDLPGTAQMTSQRRFTLGVDADPPEFGNAIPDGTERIGTSSVMVAITVDDTGSSGVDASSLEYSFSINGTTGYQEWTRRNLKTTPDGPVVDGFVLLELGDGADYFVRWRVKDLVGNGYVVSPDHGFSVDTRGIRFSEPVPPGDQWNNTTILQCGVTITDLRGSGVDVSSVEYRVSHDNISHYGPWTPCNDMSSDRPIFAPRVDLLLGEGPFNFVQWRAMDVSGTGYIASAHFRVMVDTSPITIQDFSPSGWVNATVVNCTIMVIDADGSGVNGSSLQVSFSTTDTDSFSQWQDLGYQTNAQGLEIIYEYHGVEGKTNLIRFRGRDMVGNELTSSQVYEVWIDTVYPWIELVDIYPLYRQDPALRSVRVNVTDWTSGIGGVVAFLHEVEGEGSWNLTIELVEGTEHWAVYDLSWNNGTLPTLNLEVRAWDVAGNHHGHRERILLDRSPSITGMSPKDGSSFENGTLVNFTIDLSDPDGDDLSVEWWLGDVLLSEEANFSTTSLPVGEHNISVIVRDRYHEVVGRLSIIITEVPEEPDEPPPIIDTHPTLVWWLIGLVILLCLIAILLLLRERYAEGR